MLMSERGRLMTGCSSSCERRPFFVWVFGFPGLQNCTRDTRYQAYFRRMRDAQAGWIYCICAPRRLVLKVGVSSSVSSSAVMYVRVQ